jgi:hypothetical protein
VEEFLANSLRHWVQEIGKHGRRGSSSESEEVAAAVHDLFLPQRLVPGCRC